MFIHWCIQHNGLWPCSLVWNAGIQFCSSLTCFFMEVSTTVTGVRNKIHLQTKTKTPQGISVDLRKRMAVMSKAWPHQMNRDKERKVAHHLLPIWLKSCTIFLFLKSQPIPSSNSKNQSTIIKELSMLALGLPIAKVFSHSRWPQN